MTITNQIPPLMAPDISDIPLELRKFKVSDHKIVTRDKRGREDKDFQNNFFITHLVCNLQTRIRNRAIMEIQLIGIRTSQNFARAFLLTSGIDAENFRSVSQEVANLQTVP